MHVICNARAMLAALGVNAPSPPAWPPPPLAEYLGPCAPDSELPPSPPSPPAPPPPLTTDYCYVGCYPAANAGQPVGCVGPSPGAGLEGALGWRTNGRRADVLHGRASPHSALRTRTRPRLQAFADSGFRVWQRPGAHAVRLPRPWPICVTGPPAPPPRASRWPSWPTSCTSALRTAPRAPPRTLWCAAARKSAQKRGSVGHS
jgi:hypothetical protein